MFRKFLCVLLLIVVGCVEPEIKTMPAEYYFLQLKNKSFVWHGPCSIESVIPSRQAARALAYLGDGGVPYLLDAIDDPEVEIYSLYHALSECGLPVEDFEKEIITQRSSVEIREWWDRCRQGTLSMRSRHRQEIGLPALKDNH
jgi:hypothetical protein